MAAEELVGPVPRVRAPFWRHRHGEEVKRLKGLKRVGVALDVVIDWLTKGWT